MSALAEGQRGQVLPLALMVLAGGSVILGGLMGYVSTSVMNLRHGGDALRRYYSADSGVEHALWRLNHESGFAASLVEGVPVSYSVTVNGIQVDLEVERHQYTPGTEGDMDEPGPGGHMSIGKTVQPQSAPMGEEMVFTYTLVIENIGTSRVHITEVGDLLPTGFAYVLESASWFPTNFTTEEPNINGRELRWLFPEPYPYLNAADPPAYQVFQARATLGEGIYYNEAWIVVTPETMGVVSTGQTAAVGLEGDRFNIQATAGGSTIKAAVRTNAGAVTILSWEIE